MMTNRIPTVPAAHTTAAGICERQGVAFYRLWYGKGWKRSAVYGSIPDSADQLPTDAHNAWMDGYLDNAVGRERWHLYVCKDHHNDEGGCGQA